MLEGAPLQALVFSLIFSSYSSIFRHRFIFLLPGTLWTSRAVCPLGNKEGAPKGFNSPFWCAFDSFDQRCYLGSFPSVHGDIQLLNGQPYSGSMKPFIFGCPITYISMAHFFNRVKYLCQFFSQIEKGIDNFLIVCYYDNMMNKNYDLPTLKCLRCDHTWIPRTESKPIRCPKCKSPYWNKARVHTGIPSFFRALCYEASSGGEHSYKWAGYHLALHTYDQRPYDMDDDEWEKELKTLGALIDEGNRDGICEWYRKIYPKAMRLVPSRRKEIFVDGVLEAVEAGDMSFLP